MTSKRARLLAVIGPGILVAATGVGAGDLAMGALAGSHLGVAILWAVLLGAFLKFLVTEGLTRWQFATGSTILEGTLLHLGRPVRWIFLAYLLYWTYFVASALMSACGVLSHAILPVWSPETDKIVYGIAHSLTAVVLVRLGGYRLFEKVMSVCIGVMFVTVLVTAVASRPDWSAVLQGLVVPRIPRFDSDGLSWTVALMGGVGGTVTILCYGYWIREVGRTDPEQLTISRIDIATGYTMTALFGIAMVILADGIRIDDTLRPATLMVSLADHLQTSLGEWGRIGRWMFLIGAWGAVASSLLGVWQSVPYLFAAFWNMSRRDTPDVAQAVDTSSLAYRGYLYALATIPMIGLWFGFARMQKLYAIAGAAFVPMLAVVLLILNGRAKFVGERHRNKPLTTVVLAIAVLLFLLAAVYEIRLGAGG